MNIIITGGDRWTVPQTLSESRRMDAYVEAIGDCPSRCATCAFRPGTPANQSRFVLHLIEICLMDLDNTFMCHHGLAPDAEPVHPCAGFLALRAPHP